MKKEIKKPPRRMEQNPSENRFNMSMVATMPYLRSKNIMIRQMLAKPVFEDDDYFFEVEDN
jgi:hypothetical protein